MNSELLAGSPAVTTGPLSPPFWNASKEMPEANDRNLQISLDSGVEAFNHAEVDASDLGGSLEELIDQDRLIGEIGRERRTSVPIATLPRYVPAAFVAVEDQRFYQHDGVDLIGVAGAMGLVVSLAREGEEERERFLARAEVLGAEGMWEAERRRLRSIWNL